MKKWEIAVDLKQYSEEIINLLKVNGFAIYKRDPLTQDIIHLKNSGNVRFLPNGENQSFIHCVYNGEKSLEEMGINQRKLERHEAVLSIQMHYYYFSKT